MVKQGDFMEGRSYSTAHSVAPTIHECLTRHHEQASQLGWTNLASIPGIYVIEATIEAGFWGSLRREEGRFPMISFAFLSPEQADDPFRFERPIPLRPGALSRLAPAVERPGIHLAVWRENSELFVWGATRTLPDICFVMEVMEPGLLVVKYSRPEAFGKFGNIAVFRGDHVDVVDEESGRSPECPVLLAALLGVNPSVAWLDATNVWVHLALSMRAHGRGGAVLVVPPDTRDWQRSIVQPISYRIAPSFSRLARLVWSDPSEWGDHAWRQQLRQAVEGVAGLTAVDGAMVMSERYDVYAFGTKIRRAEGAPPIQKVAVSEPVVGNVTTIVDPGEVGGTRHISAAQFVHDQRDALSLVASQDGRFTIFHWSNAQQIVHAHRIDALLL